VVEGAALEKRCVGQPAPRVRIPPSPPVERRSHYCNVAVSLLDEKDLNARVRSLVLCPSKLGAQNNVRYPSLSATLQTAHACRI
jgi:hypothetical protein